MPVFSTQQEFSEYEKRAVLPIEAYNSLSLSINENHDLRAYKESSDLVCRRCGSSLGFLVYSRQVECEASKPKKKRHRRRAIGGYQTDDVKADDVPDFELVSPI